MRTVVVKLFGEGLSRLFTKDSRLQIRVPTPVLLR